MLMKCGVMALRRLCIISRDCRTNTLDSVLRIHRCGRHQGKDCFVLGRKLRFPLPLPSHVRIVYLDIMEVIWCSIGGVAFHWLVWPRSAKAARSIARTLCTNHCNWADVLVIRGRCFFSRRRWSHSICVTVEKVW